MQLKPNPINRHAPVLHRGDHIEHLVALLCGPPGGGGVAVVVVEELDVGVCGPGCFEGEVDVVGDVGVPYVGLEEGAPGLVGDGLVDHVPAVGRAPVVLDVIDEDGSLFVRGEVSILEPSWVGDSPDEVVRAEGRPVGPGGVENGVAVREGERIPGGLGGTEFT
uniref:Uncharacterized protein n=1 Tax=Arcella intermedia TaxID=1963864 RepID=A0A6B2LLY5_9EUKA